MVTYKVVVTSLAQDSLRRILTIKWFATANLLNVRCYV
jgi:hypothetical protein